MGFDYRNHQLTFNDQDLQLNSKVYGIFFTTVQLTYTAISIDTSQTQTATLNGLRPVSGSGTPPNVEPGDVVIAMPASALGAGVSLAGSWVSAANTLSVRLAASAANTPGAVTFTVFIVKMGQNDAINS